MPSTTDKKRKRKRDNVDTEEARPHRKARVVETEADAALTKSDVPAKLRGKSRQDKSERRSKKPKKTDKHSKLEKEAEDAADVKAEGPTVGTQSEAVKGDVNPASVASGEDHETVEVRKKSKKSKSSKSKADQESSTAPRFITFVGNLPYTTSNEQIEAHFAKLAPFTVRHRTDKDTGRSKGFAFLEFDAYDRMKTCLKLYHHSIFDPEIQREDGEDGATQNTTDFERKKGRRINVELTAGGGGGKSKGRREKIKTKNQKLEEERERRRVKEKTEQEKAAPKNKPGPTGVNAESQDNRGSIHPSRMSRVAH